MLYALHFTDGGVHFANRFVQTRKRKDEEGEGRPVYRGFGTSFPNDRLRRGVMLEPPVNVSVYPFGEGVMAFGEQTLPMMVDPITLETLGECDFHGRLNEVSPFGAHPKFDLETGNMLNFGVSFSSRNPTLHLYEFDPLGKLLRRRRHPIGYPHSNHDFGLTSSYAVFFLDPLLMNSEPFWTEGKSVMECLSWEPEKDSRIVLVPRQGNGAEAVEVAAGHRCCLHLINCFESEDQVVVDILELESPVYSEYQPVPDLYQRATPGQPVRYRVDLATGQLAERRELDYHMNSDFPSIDPRLSSRAYQDFWMLGISSTGQAGRKFFDELVHGNWSQGSVSDVFRTEKGHYLGGEPIVLYDPDEAGRGLIIVEHFDTWTDQAEFLLFDAFRVADGPISRLPLQHKIHPGFHASFWPRPVAVV